jgi:hypothetical protein
VRVCLLIAAEANAQFGVPFAKYRTFETPHFILIVEVGSEDYARRAATRAEAAYVLLARAYGSIPRGKIRLIIVDQGDVFNGAATSYPTNRVLAFAHTPVEGELFYTDDPVELLVTHELAHVFHLDEARRGWRLLRRVFGRSELTFPHLFDGRYLIEGLATFYESRLTDGGRVRGVEFPETLRAALLETRGPRLDEAEFDPGAWPLDRHYVFGSCSSIISPNGTEWKPRPPGWLDARGVSDRSCHGEQASAISSVERACPRNGKTGSRLNVTKRYDCAIGFKQIPLVWPRRRACVTLRTTRRFRAYRPTDRASRSWRPTRASNRWVCMLPISRRATVGGLRG